VGLDHGLERVAQRAKRPGGVAAGAGVGAGLIRLAASDEDARVLVQLDARGVLAAAADLEVGPAAAATTAAAQQTAQQGGGGAASASAATAAQQATGQAGQCTQAAAATLQQRRAFTGETGCASR
jgi:hypothetical protein